MAFKMKGYSPFTKKDDDKDQFEKFEKEQDARVREDVLKAEDRAETPDAPPEKDTQTTVSGDEKNTTTTKTEKDYSDDAGEEQDSQPLSTRVQEGNLTEKEKNAIRLKEVKLMRERMKKK